MNAILRLKTNNKKLYAMNAILRLKPTIKNFTQNIMKYDYD